MNNTSNERSSNNTSQQVSSSAKADQSSSFTGKVSNEGRWSSEINDSKACKGRGSSDQREGIYEDSNGYSMNFDEESGNISVVPLREGSRNGHQM
jgi:hypothetical protein